MSKWRNSSGTSGDKKYVCHGDKGWRCYWPLGTTNMYIIQAQSIYSTDGRPLQSAAQLHCSPPVHSVTPCAGSGDLNNYRR